MNRLLTASLLGTVYAAQQFASPPLVIRQSVDTWNEKETNQPNVFQYEFQYDFGAELREKMQAVLDKEAAASKDLTGETENSLVPLPLTQDGQGTQVHKKELYFEIDMSKVLQDLKEKQKALMEKAAESAENKDDVELRPQPIALELEWQIQSRKPIHPSVENPVEEKGQADSVQGFEHSGSWHSMSFGKQDEEDSDDENTDSVQGFRPSQPLWPAMPFGQQHEKNNDEEKPHSGFMHYNTFFESGEITDEDLTKWKTKLIQVCPFFRRKFESGEFTDEEMKRWTSKMGMGKMFGHKKFDFGEKTDEQMAEWQEKMQAMKKKKHDMGSAMPWWNNEEQDNQMPWWNNKAQDNQENDDSGASQGFGHSGPWHSMPFGKQVDGNSDEEKHNFQNMDYKKMFHYGEMTEEDRTAWKEKMMKMFAHKDSENHKSFDFGEKTDEQIAEWQEKMQAMRKKKHDMGSAMPWWTNKEQDNQDDNDPNAVQGLGHSGPHRSMPFGGPRHAMPFGNQNDEMNGEQKRDFYKKMFESGEMPLEMPWLDEKPQENQEAIVEPSVMQESGVAVQEEAQARHASLLGENGHGILMNSDVRVQPVPARSEGDSETAMTKAERKARREGRDKGKGKGRGKGRGKKGKGGKKKKDDKAAVEEVAVRRQSGN